MALKNKYYVVWEGNEPGVYKDWKTCEEQIKGFVGAKYKGFPTIDQAEVAFKRSWKDYWGNGKTTANKPSSGYKPIKEALAVDAACSGNPGDMEYRGVFTINGQVAFHKGVLKESTNNIGEFLALVHGLALLKQMNNPMPIYSDSITAMSWVKKKKCNTKLIEHAENKESFDLIRRAELWLMNNEYTTKVYKWNTEEWGEIPADFGRK